MTQSHLSLLLCPLCETPMREGEYVAPERSGKLRLVAEAELMPMKSSLICDTCRAYLTEGTCSACLKVSAGRELPFCMDCLRCVNCCICGEKSRIRP